MRGFANVRVAEMRGAPWELGAGDCCNATLDSLHALWTSKPWDYNFIVILRDPSHHSLATNSFSHRVLTD